MWLTTICNHLTFAKHIKYTLNIKNIRFFNKVLKEQGV